MRAEELLTTTPTATEVAARAERLPSADAEALDALRRTLAASERVPTGSGWPPFLQAAHHKMDSRYADAPSSHRPVVGPVLVLAKRAFRLAFQPFINEVMRRQVEFNEAILEALAHLHEHQREASRAQAAWRQQVSERLDALERSASRPPSASEADPRP